MNELPLDLIIRFVFYVLIGSTLAIVANGIKRIVVSGIKELRDDADERRQYTDDPTEDGEQ